MDVQKALNGCVDTSPKVVLAHNPKAAKIISDQHSGIDLILSGECAFITASYASNSKIL